jgi:hypothetical protein
MRRENLRGLKASYDAIAPGNGGQAMMLQPFQHEK